jgi:hypothetical protein
MRFENYTPSRHPETPEIAALDEQIKGLREQKKRLEFAERAKNFAQKYRGEVGAIAAATDDMAFCELLAKFRLKLENSSSDVWVLIDLEGRAG